MSPATIVTESDRAAWLEERKNGIGASEAAAAMGLSPYETPLELYLRKTGQLPDREPTEAMQMGLALEPVLARLYEARTGERLGERQVFLRDARYPHLFATIDAMTSRHRPVELKTISAFKAGDLGEEESDELPEPWIIQAHQQMLVTLADAVDFAVLVGGQRFRIFRVRLNEELLAAMLVRLGKFWSRVQERDPPPPELPRDAPLLRVLRPGAEGAVDLSILGSHAARTYFDLGAQIKRLTALRDDAKAHLESEMAGIAMGNLCDGGTITRKVIPIKPRVMTLDDVVQAGGVVTIARGYDRVDLRLKDSPDTTFGGDDL